MTLAKGFLSVAFSPNNIYLQQIFVVVVIYKPDREL